MLLAVKKLLFSSDSIEGKILVQERIIHMTIEQAKAILKNPELGRYLTREEMEAIDFLISMALSKEQK
jgi:hypothetical protein